MREEPERRITDLPVETHPSLRTPAIVGLLAVSIVRSFAFQAALTSMDVTYTATVVWPGESADRVLAHLRLVIDLDERLSGMPEAARQPVERAATNGSFDGNVTRNSISRLTTSKRRGMPCTTGGTTTGSSPPARGPLVSVPRWLRSAQRPSSRPSPRRTTAPRPTCGPLSTPGP